jgi:hypothetical protein
MGGVVSRWDVAKQYDWAIARSHLTDLHPIYRLRAHPCEVDESQAVIMSLKSV